MTDDVLLKATELCRSFKGRAVLDHVSLSINGGERIAVTGPSGSGKSLLLRSLAMLEPIDGGTLQWRGATLADKDVPRFRSQVMYVQQRTAQFDETVLDVLRMPYALSIHRHREFSRQHAADWLKRLGRPGDMLSQLHSELSGGESQLIALVRALQLDPVILLLDEATAAIDPDTTALVESLILEWQASQSGRSFLWVSHDARQSERMTQRSISLLAGHSIGH
ncbi:ABC transporter ATP-binding protein [Stieleria varia]|uniref:Putative ABC transporter ATP-binding protein YbbL n=1 Tax=Stieleria varia TaxID=2528005 RepID=A0A5C6B2J3_9BACT|nr:ATP-binding cassette domain-containing protein [Stieleria varia]TWU06120.1 putative ABC transporter ATP-binding protein YbbL [Stieleria varia]